MTTKDWLIVAVIAFAGAFLGTVFTTVAPVLPLIVRHYGGGEHGAFVATWLLTVPSFGIMVGGPLSGWLVERLGARTVLLACFAVFGLAGLGGIFIEKSELLLASRFLVGLAAAGQATAATVVAGDRFVGNQRSFVLGVQVALAALIGVGSAFATGALAEAAGWRAPFALYGAALALGVLAACVVDRNSAPPLKSKMGNTALLSMAPVFLIIILTMMVSFISSNQVPLLLSEQGSGDPSVLSAVVGGNTLATTLGALLYSRLRIELGAVRTSAIGGTLQGAAIILLALGAGLYSIAISSLILGFGGGLLYPGFSHTILDRAPATARGRAVGLLFTAQFAGPLLSTAVVIPAIATFGRYDSLMTIGVVLQVGWSVHAVRRSVNDREPNTEVIMLPSKDLS